MLTQTKGKNIMVVFTNREQKGGELMPLLDSKVIGNRLKTLRGDKTIKEVAESLRISESALSMYETGNRIPRDEIKIRIAQYYDRSVQSIFYA